MKKYLYFIKYIKYRKMNRLSVESLFIFLYLIYYIKYISIFFITSLTHTVVCVRLVRRKTKLESAQLVFVYFNLYLMLYDLNFLFQIFLVQWRLHVTCRYQASFMHNTKRALKIQRKRCKTRVSRLQRVHLFPLRAVIRCRPSFSLSPSSFLLNNSNICIYRLPPCSSFLFPNYLYLLLLRTAELNVIEPSFHFHTISSRSSMSVILALHSRCIYRLYRGS